jgi:hypothetical protein
MGRTNRLLSFSYDTDRIENDASNNTSLPRKRVYRAIALQRQGDTQTDPQTLILYDTERTENEAPNNSSLFRVFVAEGTYTSIPSRCVATKEGYTYKHTD